MSTFLPSSAKIGCAVAAIALILGPVWLSEPTYIETVDIGIGTKSERYIQSGGCRIWGHAVIEAKYIYGIMRYGRGQPKGNVEVEQGKDLLPRWLIAGAPKPWIAAGECVDDQRPAAMALYDTSGKRVAYTRCDLAPYSERICSLERFAAPSQSPGRTRYWLRLSGTTPIPVAVTRSIRLKSAFWEGLMGI